MQPQNTEEYKGLRHEIEVLKNCVTTYIGFVFIVVSAAFWEVTKAAVTGRNVPMAFIAPMLAIGLKLVLFILLYKFHSHNRYCGYCKLLEQEVYEPGNIPKAVFVWEICLDRLRMSDTAKRGLDKEIRSYKGISPTKEQLEARAQRYGGPDPKDDRSPFYFRWKLLLRSHSLFRSLDETRGTWHFPLYVAQSFALIDLAFLILSFALLMPRDLSLAGQLSRSLAKSAPVFLGWLSLLALLLFVWHRLLARLYRQMSGSQTVDAFCWKFVAIRYRILEAMSLAYGHKLASGYKLIGMDLAHIGNPPP